MPNWRDAILKSFKRGISRLTLVSDPDGLLTEERMAQAIRERGFEIITFDDPIAFRYAYEAKYRTAWDEGRETDLVVVLRSEKELGTLPYDLLKAGRQLSFALHKLFPKLSYPVIESLDRSTLDALYEAYQTYDGSTMGDRTTKEFVLTHCFGIVPKLVKTPVDLLKLLLSRHYGGVALPESLDDLLLGTFTAERALAGWPLREIVPSRQKFLAFLQEQWPLYVTSFHDPAVRTVVPFGHEDVRVYIDTLFLEGVLTPIPQEDVSKLPKWVLTGVAHDVQADALNRMRRLLERFAHDIPAADASHRDWQRAAATWAELVVLRWELDGSLAGKDRAEWEKAQASMQERFSKWLQERFASLASLPPVPLPVMVHHIARHLAAVKAKSGLEKIALVVVDGLAMDQWLIVRKHLEVQRPSWRIEENTAFAWVPTLTSVSLGCAASPPRGANCGTGAQRDRLPGIAVASQPLLRGGKQKTGVRPSRLSRGFPPAHGPHAPDGRRAPATPHAASRPDPARCDTRCR